MAGDAAERMNYATAYYSEENEYYTTGLGAIAANSHNASEGRIAGQNVRMMCELSGDEVRRRRSGTIIINHLAPSREGLSLYDRAAIRLAKIVSGAFGESHKTKFTPIPDDALSTQELAYYEGENAEQRQLIDHVVEAGLIPLT